MRNRRADHDSSLFATARLHLPEGTLNAQVVDLGGGGVRLRLTRTFERPSPGTTVTIGLALSSHTTSAIGLEFLHFDIDVLDVVTDPSDGSTVLRGRNLTPRRSFLPRFEMPSATALHASAS